MNLFFPNIEMIGGPLVTVQREPHALGQHRTNDILDSERLRVVDLRIKPVIVEVPAWDFQSVVIDHAAQFRRGMAIDIPIGLDLRVADLANGFEHGGKIALCLVANGVQLSSEGTALRGKKAGSGQPAGSRNPQLQKPATVKRTLENGHFLPVLSSGTSA